ncbi:hypothetical protein [uncultured Flavobacterium sp.]|uniref:hypothetical protein n=1 Tax=uncultured Flavobacterium sp. TaxID=165435 RepID=UPI0025E2F64E|nr:hypothetical protein [uncultured Flavobacterium sp.]
MKSILKSIAVGILIGALAFFAFKLIITFFIIGGIMSLFARRRFSRQGFGPGKFGGPRFAFADKIRNMNDEEYNSFKANFESSRCRNHRSERSNTQTK